MLKGVSEFIKLRRKELGLSQSDLANTLSNKVNYKTILNFEKGKNISLATFLDICNALQVKMTLKK